MRGSFLRNMGCFFNRVACCPECHTSSSEMPHFDKVNAAFRECSSVAFALVKCGVCLVECGIPDSEVWYLFTPSPSFFLTTTSFFSLLFSSYLLLRARGQVFIVPICIIAHYDVFFLSDFFFKFSNCFAIVLHFTESFH
jgi:hypothetical protein